MQSPLPSAVSEVRHLLRRQQRWFGGRAMAPDDAIARIIQVFEQRNAGWALIGAVAFGVRVEPRATRDVDFVVEARHLPGVLADLRAAFGDLGEQDIGAAVRLTALDVDLVRSSQHPLFHQAVQHAETIEGWRVPRPEVLVALKFMSAVNPWRERSKRIQDTSDLVALYEHTAEFDRELAITLSAAVYPGAERELASLLDRIDRGEKVEV